MTCDGPALPRRKQQRYRKLPNSGFLVVCIVSVRIARGRAKPLWGDASAWSSEGRQRGDPELICSPSPDKIRFPYMAGPYKAYRGREGEGEAGRKRRGGRSAKGGRIRGESGRCRREYHATENILAENTLTESQTGVRRSRFPAANPSIDAATPFSTPRSLRGLGRVGRRGLFRTGTTWDIPIPTSRSHQDSDRATTSRDSTLFEFQRMFDVGDVLCGPSPNGSTILCRDLLDNCIV